MKEIPRALLQAEATRRDRWREALTRAVLASFVVSREDADGPGRFAIRRMEVYRAVAAALKVRLIRPAFCTEVRSVVSNMGAIPTRVRNVKMFRGVHRRELCPEQAAVESRRLRAEAHGRRAPGATVVTRATEAPGKETWESILESEGLPAELDAARVVDVGRAAINGNRLAKATDAFWSLDEEHTILRLYMEGCSIRDIVERTGLSRKVVHSRLIKHGLSTVGGERE